MSHFQKIIFNFWICKSCLGFNWDQRRKGQHFPQTQGMNSSFNLVFLINRQHINGNAQDMAGLLINRACKICRHFNLSKNKRQVRPTIPSTTQIKKFVIFLFPRYMICYDMMRKNNILKATRKASIRFRNNGLVTQPTINKQRKCASVVHVFI